MRIHEIAGRAVLALTASLLAAGTSVAAPYATTYTGTMSASTTAPYAIIGQTYEVTFVFDNGGATASSQTWDDNHLQCAIWKFNNARNVVFRQNLSSPGATGSITTNAAGVLQSNFSDVSYGSGTYTIIGTSLSGVIPWYANEANSVFGMTTRVYDAAGGVQMDPASWSNPAPFSGDCDGVYLGAPPAPAAVPTMSEWAMILLGTMLAGFASLTIMRRRQIL